MPKPLKDLTISAKVNPLVLAGILRYYRTKDPENAPENRSALVSAIMEDFHQSLEAAEFLVPFITREEAFEYLGTKKNIPRKPVAIPVSLVRESKKEVSTNSAAAEIFAGLNKET